MGHLSRWIGCFKKIYMRACLSLLLPWTLISLDLPLLDDNQMLLRLLSGEVMLLHHERLVNPPAGSAVINRSWFFGRIFASLSILLKPTRLHDHLISSKHDHFPSAHRRRFR